MSKIVEWANGWEDEPFESENFDLMAEELMANQKIQQVRISSWKCSLICYFRKKFWRQK